MAQIELRLSNKMQKETEMSEVLIRFYQGTKFNTRAKSGIFVSPQFFEYYIDRDKTEKLGVKIPGHITTATSEKAKRLHYVLRQSGTVVVLQRLETPDVKYHREQLAKLNELKKLIVESYESNRDKIMSSDWLQLIVDKYHDPTKYEIKPENKGSFFELVEEYIEKRQLADSHARVFRVLSRAIARFQGFVRSTDKDKSDYEFDIDKVTRDDIERLTSYLRNEKKLSEDYPKLFKKLINDYPAAVKKGHNRLEERGENTIIKMRTRLKSLFLFFYEEGLTTNRPFDGVKIGTAKVGTPYYITIDERNKIAETNLEEKWKTMDEDFKKKCKMPIQTLITCRDIFVFQCLIGCRVSDLIKLTPEHINNGILVYTPHKTKDEGDESIQARVPLHAKAQELIKKYKGVDKMGRLFPFITAQKYNDAIKAIFTMAGVTRNVEVRNPLTGENEIRPINEIASSHLARRTFVGNAYFKVSDPNLIGKMSGHVDGSKAFKRYRKIEDETLKNVIDMIG
ncbi:MAG: integrase catalytic domain-containing protein [Prevotella sp.]|nr:integrase catalytic domain-containing protein [Prevotella sp.]